MKQRTERYWESPMWFWGIPRRHCEQQPNHFLSSQAELEKVHTQPCKTQVMLSNSVLFPSVNSSSRKPCIIQQGLGGSVRPRERRSASCVGQGGKSRLWLLGFLPGESSVFRIPQDAWATSTKARGGKGENYTLLWLKIGLKFRYRIYFLLLNYPRMLRLTDTSWKF